MLVGELFAMIESRKDYVENSLKIVSYDEKGIVVKFLVKKSHYQAERKELFIATESDGTENIEDWTVIAYYYVEPPKM